MIRPEAYLVSSSLGCLQRIYFLVFFLSCSLLMGGHTANANAPFGGRIRENKAIFSGRKTLRFFAAFALLNYGMACPPVELAAILIHEETLVSFLDVRTNHFNHILSL
jgi:hypothetical protein